YETALGVYLWSHGWMEAQRFLSRTPAERLAPAEAHLARMKELEKVIMPEVAAQRRGVESYLGADFYRYDAEALVLQEKAGPNAEATVAAATRRLAAVVLIYDTRRKQEGTPAPNFFFSLFWSRQWFDAENALRPKTAERLANAEAYLSRAVELEKLAKNASSQPRYPMDFLHVATFYRLDAEILVSQMKADGRADKPAHLEKAKARLEAAKAAYE